VLALTDHDSVDGVAPAVEAGRRLGVTVIPGLELSTDVPAGELHMLGYFIDPGRVGLREALRHQREGRTRRAARMVEQLRQVGVVISLDDVRRQAAGGALGRPHVARVLVADGYAVSVDDAFNRYLVRGRPGYVPRPRLSPTDAIALVHGAGGAAVLAHPYSVADLAAVLAELRGAGLDGLEAYYAAYTPDQRATLAALADEGGLVATGGSDFHGPGQRAESELGAAPLPPGTVERLAAIAARWAR
jgi:predicted metal-dependent phosphoesterase TrpH